MEPTFDQYLRDQEQFEKYHGREENEQDILKNDIQFKMIPQNRLSNSVDDLPF